MRNIFTYAALLMAGLFFGHVPQASGQETLPGKTGEQAGVDSLPKTLKLTEITVHAFAEDKKITDLPSPVFHLSGADLQRYNDESVVMAVNTVPGVTMEQRSPASYRLNIRGSSLRSPFGVRNVKVYYNGMPLTDPGGDTYLNALSFPDFGSMQVIKGPAGSIYGAGTGGVMLINSPLDNDGNDSTFSAGLRFIAGSYGRSDLSAYMQWGSASLRNALRLTDSHSNGYRRQSAMHEKGVSYEAHMKSSDRQQLSLFMHYSDLFYETPGGLTLAEYKADPRAARPASGAFPSAEESGASVRQQAFYAGVNNTYKLTEHFSNNTVLYGAFTDFTNPTTRNYEYRKEPHFGARTVFSYEWQADTEKKKTLLWGAEWQQGYFTQKDMGNDGGYPDTLQTDYQINNSQSSVFAQADLNFAQGWNVVAGASLNFASLDFSTLYPAPVTQLGRDFQNGIMPRLALLKKIRNGLVFYGSLSGGFSPPTVSELLPSTAVLNQDLEAEKGTDFELGSRGYIGKDRLYYDVNAFVFDLRQSISQRRDSSGADYFVNAGGTRQRGLEAYLSYVLYRQPSAFVRSVNISLSQTWFHFRYRHYAVEDKNYSGNPLPGVASYRSVLGFDIALRCNLSLHLNWNYTGPVVLSDDNTAKADAYHLVDARLDYSNEALQKWRLQVFGGVDNLLNQTYSLGNDINAAGGRYFNAAPGINFFVGASVAFGGR